MDLYSLCNRYKWFVGGTREQYNKLFDMERKGRSAKELALVIWLCSPGYTEEQIYDILKNEGYVKRHNIYRKQIGITR